MFELILACKHENDIFLKLLELECPSLEKVLATATAFEAARAIREMAVLRSSVLDKTKKIVIDVEGLSILVTNALLGTWSALNVVMLDT